MGPVKKYVERELGKKKDIITMEAKREMIEKHERGMRVTEIARFYKKSTSTICTILKKKKELRELDAAKGVTRLSKQRPRLLEEVEKLILVWINEKQLAGDTITQNLICEKAKALYAELGSKIPCTSIENEVHADFKASKGTFLEKDAEENLHYSRINIGSELPQLSRDTKITFQCIPSHIGLKGNDTDLLEKSTCITQILILTQMPTKSCCQTFPQCTICRIKEASPDHLLECMGASRQSNPTKIIGFKPFEVLPAPRYDVLRNEDELYCLSLVGPIRRLPYYKRTQAKIRIMQGLVHYEFVPEGQTINQHYYLDVLRRLREAVRQKRPEKWHQKNWLLHHDNARPHTAVTVQLYLAKHGIALLPQPPYSPELAPNDSFLYPKIEKVLKRRRFDSIPEIKENTKNILKSLKDENF
ncbi:hypothetical protein LAZ67_10001012 [Cordylochernes scorpioides]|uniref:BESS domain-containing protein n=1 Tax=Cordylochernes scorpioides TaxID=51811 RepID=A0ABY6KVG9_9ARAC|nr:hypothetical protein LAZ67_10001012 [Cordylochernes scorpioides]